MPFLEHRQRLYPLRGGENVIGGASVCDVRIPQAREDVQLTVTVESMGSFAWAAANGGASLNGRQLTRDPVQLFNGDELRIEDHVLTFVEDEGSGAGGGPGGGDRAASRQRPMRPSSGSAVNAHRDGNGSPDARSRVVGVLRRLENGQTYIISRDGFRIGREKRCDVVVPDRSVSRLHAEISFERGRYVLRDLGRTGTRVNGSKVQRAHELEIGDVIRIGEQELAFARRPASAEELVQPDDVTPIRGSVQEAPTVEVSSVASTTGLVVRWLLILAGGGAIATMLLIG